MTKPWRTVSVLAAGLLALLMVLSAVAWSQWQGFKHEQGIELLEWQGLRLSSGGISAERVRYAQNPDNGPHLAASASGITLRLPSFFARCRLVRCKSTSLSWRFARIRPPATASRQQRIWNSTNGGPPGSRSD